MLIAKKLKKSLIFVMITVLLLGQATPGYAVSSEDDEAGIAPLALDSSKPTIYLDYLGTAEASADRGPQSAPQPLPGFTNANSGTIFWVGVRLDNLNQVDFLKNDGLQKLEIAFDYNPELVVPCDDLAATEYDSQAIVKDDWMKIITDVNFSNNGEGDTWDSSHYSLSNYSAYEATPDTAEGREYSAPSTWKTQFISILKKDNDKTTNRFYGVDNADGHYILKIPFQLKSAPDDGSKPLAFRLALGPSTLVMAAGDSGSVSYQWEKEDKTIPELNLKNTFQFAGDLNIFKSGSELDEMTDFAVSYKGAEDVDYEAAQLYSDEEQNVETKFLPGTKEYYISVPSNVTEVKLDMSSLQNKPSVQRWNYGTTPDETNPADAIDAEEDSKLVGNWSASVPLKGSGVNYTDTISITINDGTETPPVYLVHVKKEAGEDPPTGEARIELVPGNSPYGEIMKDDTVWRTLDEYKDLTTPDPESGLPEGRVKWQEDAKASFNESNSFTDADLTPKSMEAQLNARVRYSTRAWVDIDRPNAITPEEQAQIDNPEINMDRNEDAMFIYNGESFVDPGFVAYDSAGNQVEKINREITVSRIKDGFPAGHEGFLDENQQVEANVLIADQDASYEITDLTPKLVAGGPRYLRPDIYTMKYYFEDPVAGEVSIYRKVIVVTPLGDDDNSGGITSNDTSMMEVFVANNGSIPGFIQGDTIKSSAYRVFMYRVVDTDYSNTITSNDSNDLEFYVATNGQNPLVEYYNKLVPKNVH